MQNNTQTSHSILIAGAGISGLFAAIALSRAGHKVKLMEQDAAPPQADANQAFTDWKRPGVGQVRHSHAFLARLVNVLQNDYPDLLQALIEAGARPLLFENALSPGLREKYEPDPSDKTLTLLSCRRTTLELVLREYAGRQDNICVQHCTKITGLLTRETSDDLKICGLSINQNDCCEAEVRADIVIDATGRLSPFPGWFKALGIALPEENGDAEILYYTRHYRLHEGAEEPPRSDVPANGDLGYLKYGVFPADNGRFSVTLCTPIQEKGLRGILRNGEQFDKICNTFPGMKPWMEPERSEPVGGVYMMGDIRSRYRHYVKEDKALALNFFALGDALIRTNPLYGRGCSLGMVQAHLLTEALAATTDPAERAILFDTRVAEEVRPHYLDSIENDQNAIRNAARTRSSEPEKRTLKTRLSASFMRAIQAAAREDIEITRAFSRAFNLLDKPKAVLKNKRLMLKIVRYWLRGDKRNAPPVQNLGPKRDEMFELLGLQVEQQGEA